MGRNGAATTIGKTQRREVSGKTGKSKWSDAAVRADGAGGLTESGRLVAAFRGGG